MHCGWKPPRIWTPSRERHGAPAAVPDPRAASSLLLASPLALVLLIHPAAMLDGQAATATPADAGDVGISAGFVHGVGFVPQWWGWRWLLGPLPAWLFCALGYAVLTHARLG